MGRSGAPNISPVNPLGAEAIALVVGLLVGGLVVWLAMRERHEPPPLVTFESDIPVVPDGVAEVLAVLHAAGVVVGPHDEILQATAVARTLGLVRGNRVAMPELLELARSVRRDGKGRNAELEIDRGSRAAALHLEARVAPLGTDLVLIVADDRTASRRVEQTRRDFVANVSHELKTPIGAISLLAEAVMEAADDPAAVRKFAGRMDVESARLTDLVGQIIDLSRLQSDDPLAEAKEVDVDALLADAVDRCRVKAEQHHVTLALGRPSGATVLGNRRQLRTAIVNLVENAVVYSDPGARVVVAAHRQAASDDDYVEITVSDTGIGLRPEELERVFERFYRVDYARSRANGGSGLGLSIVKHIAASHGGEVGVWSRPGQGSTFTIRMPAHLTEPVARPTDREEIRR